MHADEGARAGERYFGCGERTAGLEKTGSHQVFWNVDPPHGHTAALNNMYTSIPFVLSLQGGPRTGCSSTMPGRVELDLAKADPDASPRRPPARSSTTSSPARPRAACSSATRS